MNKHLAQLIELANVDREIDDFGPKEERINARLNAILAEQEKNAATIAALDDEIKECDVKRRKSETHLAELSEKLKQLDEKSNAVKSEKELKALQLEEEIAKEQVTFANEEIERLEKISVAKKEEIESLNTSNGDLESQATEAREASQSEIEALEVEKRETFMKKEKLVAEVQQKVLSFYQKIRRWAGNSAVVPVRKQACHGCYMKLGDRIYAEVIKSEEITTCPSCGRILYIEEAE